MCEQLESQAAKYNEVRNPFGVKAILNLIEPGDVVLDGGCGTGQHAYHLATKASQVIGIDTDVARIAIAQSHCPDLNNVTFEVGSVTQLPFEDNSFDVVLLAQVLHHLAGKNGFTQAELRQQCRQALLEAKRVLRMEGRLILVTTSRIQRRVAYWHFNFFPPSAWEKLDPIWSLTEDEWFTSVMAELGFLPIGNVTPSESHWREEEDETIVKLGLDPSWRATDVAFDLLNATQLDEFVTQVKAVLTDGSVSELINTARLGRLSHGEATVFAYQLS